MFGERLHPLERLTCVVARVRVYQWEGPGTPEDAPFFFGGGGVATDPDKEVSKFCGAGTKCKTSRNCAPQAPAVDVLTPGFRGRLRVPEVNPKFSEHERNKRSARYRNRIKQYLRSGWALAHYRSLRAESAVHQTD